MKMPVKDEEKQKNLIEANSRGKQATKPADSRPISKGTSTPGFSASTLIRFPKMGIFASLMKKRKNGVLVSVPDLQDKES